MNDDRLRKLCEMTASLIEASRNLIGEVVQDGPSPSVIEAIEDVEVAIATIIANVNPRQTQRRRRKEAT